MSEPSTPPAIPTRKHASFSKSYADYAVTFDSDPRAIKRWVRIGKESGALPPLDDPSAMAGWWSVHMKHSVPDKLLALSGKPASSNSGNTTATSADPPPDASPLATEKGLSLAENVEELRVTLARSKRLLDQALPGNDERQIALRQKNYKDIFELLRKAEQTLTSEQEARGNTVSRDLVAGELAQLSESLRIMHDAMPERILIELEKLLPRRFARILNLLRRHLVTAIERVRVNERNIFRKLESLEGPETVRELLAA